MSFGYISTTNAIESAYRGKTEPSINLKTWSEALNLDKNNSQLSKRDVNSHQLLNQ